MSRIGRSPIKLGSVKMERQEKTLKFSHNNKQLNVALPDFIDIKVDNDTAHVFPIGSLDDRNIRSNWGTVNRLVANAIKGLTSGFEKKVKLVGTGYKVFLEGTKLKFQLGYSHDVYVDIPSAINVKVEGNVSVVMNSCDKELVGRFSYSLTKLKKYNVYKGKGVLEEGRFYRRKNAIKK